MAGFSICDTDAAYSEKVKRCILIVWIFLFSTSRICINLNLIKCLHFRHCWYGEMFSRSLTVKRGKGIVLWIDVCFHCKMKLQGCWKLCVSLFRIVVVKQTRDVLPPLNNSSKINVTLVDLVMRSILPTSPHLLSAQEVADAIETHLQTTGDIWPSWTVRLKALFSGF